jgi:hypothetical protein
MLLVGCIVVGEICVILVTDGCSLKLCENEGASEHERTGAELYMRCNV